MASPGGVEVGRVSVRVVPDTSRIGADLKVALDRIEASTDLKISTSIDTTELDAQARAAVDQAQVAAGNIHLKTEVDTSQIREAELSLANATGAANGFSSSLGGIATAAILLGPALIPLAAVLGGLIASLVAPLAIVGGGLTLFGVIAGLTVSETQKQLKVISQLDTKLSGLKKGTQEYADTAAKLRDAQAALTPAQAAFAKSLDKVKAAFDAIPKSIVLKPLTDGLDLLARILPFVTPILKVVSGFLDDLIVRFDKFARSAGFKDFVTAFAHQLGPDLRAFGAIAGNIFTGLFGLFGAFNDQLSGSVLKSLENLTGKFANWGKTVGDSKGFRSFVAYLRQVGPKVTKALGDIAQATGDIVIAFAPIGTVVVGAIDGMARAIHKVPAGVLETVATSLVVLVASAKLLGPLQGLIAGIIAAPEVAIVVGLIAALAVGFTILYQHSKPLQRIIGDLGDFFREKLLPPIKDAAKQVIPAFKSALHDINQTLRQNRPYLETLGKALLAITSAVVIGGLIQLAGSIRLFGKAFKVGVTASKAWTDTVLIGLRIITRAYIVFVTFLLGVYGKIVDGAATAFGWMPKIGGKVKAAQAAFHSFSDSVLENVNRAGDRLKALQDQVDGITGPKPFKITVDDLKAVKDLEDLQAFRIKDKSFRITENVLERIVGPGGGQGRPGQTSGTRVNPPSLQNDPSSRTTTPNTRGGTNINVGTVQAHDYNDFLRQLTAHQRAQGGGGVSLAGAR